MKLSEQPITAITMPPENDGSVTTYFGLSKREYFAGLALQRTIKLTYTDKTLKDSFKRFIRIFGFKTNTTYERVFDAKSDCQAAIMYADEILKQLEK